MKLFYSIIISLLSVAGYSQTILHQNESTTRTVQDPQTVIMAPGFKATSGISNPFVAKIGPGTENPGGGPVESQAGANNPSGTTASPGENYHSTKGNIDVTNNGQLQFSLPISLPPGIRDVLPNLTLSYLSGAGNGIAGYGWSISGITNISRAGKSIEKDGIFKGLSLDNTDIYSYNGQRLILKSGVNGGDGAEYYAEKYSNVKIKSIGAVNSQLWQGPEFWEITFEDGSQAWYGAFTTGDSTGRSPLEYNIVKWKDNQGNYINYNYIKNNNISLLSKIEWGGNEVLGKVHFNKIDFIYTQRFNVESLYVKGISFIEDKILNSIVVSSDNTVFRTYNIEYTGNENVNNDTSHTIKYQFVKNVTVSNSAGENAKPITFQTKLLTTNVTESNFGDFSDITTSGDYNGDGLIDFIVKKPAVGNLPAGYYLYFNAVNSDTNFVYLGTDANLYPGYLGTTGSHVELHTVNIVPQDNIIKPKQGIVTITTKSNIYIPYLPLTYDIELRYFSIKSDASVLNTTNNPLVLEYSRTLGQGDYLYDPIIYPNQPQPWFSYEEDQPVSSFITAKEVDIDSDGLSELVLSIADQRCYKRDFSTPYEDIYRWDCENAGNRFLIIDKNDLKNNTVHLTEPMNQNLFLHMGNGNTSIMDFDNDGVQDIMVLRSTTNSTNVNFFTPSFVTGNVVSRTFNTRINDLQQYELKKENDSYQVNFKKAFTVKGFAHEVKYGDLNGDKNIEILLPLHDYTVNDEYKNGWSIYLNTGNDLQESLQGLMIYKAKYGSPNDPTTTSSVLDIDGDGKGEILNSYTLFDYGNNSQSVRWGLDSFSEPVYNANDPQFKWRFTERRLFSSQRPKSTITPFFGDFRINNSNSKVLFLLKSLNSSERKVISYQHYNINIDKNISTILQEDIQYDIDYKELDPVINANLYAPIKKEEYPYVEMERLAQTFAVSQIRMSGRKQDFRYRGYVAHLQGRGIIGFRKIARSSWYADGFESTKIWNGVEIDPLTEGLPIKEWSIRTNDENNIFPLDISANNSQLLSFKSTQYQIKKLLNGQVVTTVSDTDKHKVVTAILPSINYSKNFLTNTTKTNTISYGEYYLPNISTENINDGYAITTSLFEYIHGVAGIGSGYFIGRPKSRIVTSQVYGDTKSLKEEYTYENNQVKTLKTWNRDNTEYLLESYVNDGFGNLTEKVVSNSLDSQTNISKTVYEPKGRFVVKKTDNLGLEINITYNNWGQILTQANPLGNVLTNTYDNWGKLLKSKTNLGGTTTYQYDKDDNSNITLTQYDPNGDISKKYTNKLGQNYKVSTKAFGQGQFVSKTTTYDTLGRKIRESEPYFEGQNPSQWNVLTYDDTVFPPKVTSTALAKINTLNEITSFTGKRLITTVSGLTTTIKENNGYGRTNSKTTDALGNVLSSNDKGGTIQFTFNAAGEQTKAQYAENIVTTKYDAWGRRLEFNDPSNGIYKYEYDGFGQPKKIISPKGIKEYTYNNLGQLITQKELSTSDNGQATNKTITYSYDNKGRIISKFGTSKGKSYSSNVSYDPQGRVLSSSESSNGKYFIQKGITYDDKARVISYEKQLYSSGILSKVQIENMYSAWNGELYQIKDKNSGKILWELKETNARGQVLKAKLGAADINNLYDDNGFLNSINHSSAVKPSILQISYSFDAIMNELKRRSTGGDFTINEFFDYDDNNRLINWTNPVTGFKVQNAKLNVYDAKGRILENDQIGKIKFENSSKIYQPTGMALNTEGTQNYNNDLIQSVAYNENNDPAFIDGEKGDVAFQYGLTAMRQRVTYGGNFSTDGEGKFTKYYNDDGSFEIVKDNITGKEKHILYIGGTPYESNIVYLKDFIESNGSYKFLHKDYLGSILAISDEAGSKLEQRHFDAWGNFTHLKIGNGAIITDKNIINNTSLLLERGYTSHEHFAEVGIIHMNGRLYDPLLRRFLNADENIQDPYNTQNYNKYGYVMNNPLMFNDPSGEIIVAPIVGLIIAGAIKGVIIGGLIYTGMAALTGNASKAGFLKSVVTSAIVGGISGGVGALNIFGNGFWGTVAQGTAIGAAGGTVDAIVNNTPILQGVIKGAVIGGTVAVVSYTIKYYTTPTGSKTSVLKDTPENAVKGNTPVGNRSYAQDLYENQFGTQTGLDKNDIYNRAVPGGEMTCNCSEGVIRYNYKGKEIDALAVADSQTVDKGFLKGKITTHKLYLSHKAFASREQLAFVMQHELGHVRVYNAGLRSDGEKNIKLENDTTIKYSNLLDNAEHYHIQQYGTSFLENNGWNNIKSSIPSNVFNSNNFKMYNQQIWNVLKGTDMKININFK